MDALKVAQKFLNAYDFSSVQLQIPDVEANEIYKWGKENIPDRLLAAEGREKDIHVTIKYGIHRHDFTEARNLFIKEKPIKIVLGNVSLFNSDEHDVIKIDISSPDLYRLNKLISSNFEVTDTYPLYKPHITVAYILPSFGDSYDGDSYFRGKNIISDSIVFSGKDNRRILFKLAK